MLYEELFEGKKKNAMHISKMHFASFLIQLSIDKKDNKFVLFYMNISNVFYTLFLYVMEYILKQDKLNFHMLNYENI